MRLISLWRPRSVAPLFAVAAVLVAVGVADAQGPQRGIRVTKGKAPDRDGTGTVEVDENWCPPLTASLTKHPANQPEDADKDGDGTNDYFLGEWEFVEGTKDLKVKVWCINKPPTTHPDGSVKAWNDYFTYEVLTSEDGTDTPAVAPDSTPASEEYPEGLPRAGAT